MMQNLGGDFALKAPIGSVYSRVGSNSPTPALADDLASSAASDAKKLAAKAQEDEEFRILPPEGQLARSIREIAGRGSRGSGGPAAVAVAGRSHGAAVSP